MPLRYSIAEARDHLTRLVHQAETGTPIEVTRRGKPVAVLLSIEQYHRLAVGHKSFWAALESFRQHVDISELGFQAADFQILRDRSPGRGVNL